MTAAPGPDVPPLAARLSRLLAAAWRSGLLPEPRLERAALEAAAWGRRGPEPDDPGSHAEPLERLLADLRDHAALSPLGKAMAHGQIVGVLRARRRAYRLWREHPGILARPVAAPVIVVGPMRSGTTRIHRLLACDPRFAHTRLFESIAPVPPRLPRALDPRPLRAWAGLRLLGALNPALAGIHPTGPFRAEEEFGLIGFGFGPAAFEAQWHVPEFSRWWESADRGPLYREFRRLIQTIGWRRRDPPDRRWLMKAPQFQQDLPFVLEQFPDARLLCLERDPPAVAASAASLVWNQTRIQSDKADPVRIGRAWARKTRMRNEAARRALDARPDVPRLEIGFDAVNRDWRAEIGRIYSFLGLSISPAIERRMAAYVAGERAHLGHSYRPEQFGL